MTILGLVPYSQDTHKLTTMYFNIVDREGIEPPRCRRSSLIQEPDRNRTCNPHHLQPILKHTTQYADGPYIFTIPFFGRSKGSLPRLCILSVTSQAMFFNMASTVGISPHSKSQEQPRDLRISR